MINIKITEQIHPFDNSIKIEMVEMENQDGSFTSMTKAYYDELEAQREQSGTL